MSIINQALRSIQGLRLGLKVTILAAGSSLVTLLALVGIAVWQGNAYNALAQREVDTLIRDDLMRITTSIYNFVRAENAAVDQQLSTAMAVARREYEREGGMRIESGTVLWTATNQFTGETKEIILPELSTGGERLVPGAEKSSFVDEVSRLIGCEVTLFQRMNGKGDMLRVATTVRSSSGKRASGYYIPIMDADGNRNPVMERILDGGSFKGRAYVVDSWHLTAYEPIRDASGGVMGMIFVGLRQKNVEAKLRRAVLDMKIGESGYAFVVEGRGDHRGRYIISQGGLRDGENIWDVRDDKGEYSARAIVDKAVALSEGEIGFISYRWKNIGDNDFRAKIAAVAYYEPWDWVIGTSIYEDEIETYSRVLALGRRRTTRIMAAIGAAIACVVGFSGFLVSRRIFAPLEKITASAEALAAGGTNFEAELLSGDEVGILSNAFMRMARRIQNSLKELRESEEKYRSIYENSVDGIFRTNMSGMILHANPALSRILGFESPEELLTRNLNVARDVYADPGERDAFLKELLDNGVIHGKEVRIRKADGSVIWVSFSARSLADEKGLPTIIEGFLSDITEKHQAEDSLRKSLKKSELLLREVHHRVKNNLQLLSSLLSFKANVASNDDSSDFYAEFAVRIGSMAHIHEQLFGLAESSDIDLADFTRSIASYLYQEHRQHFSQVSIRIDAEPVRISLERATPYGLLIGEVLSNAFLHAFPLGLRDEGTIAITIQSSAEGSVEVVIADDGVGLPSSVDPVAPERLGFAVVQMLVSQLEADMEVTRGRGTTFRIRFMRDE